MNARTTAFSSGLLPAVKICGLTRAADVRLCLDLGAAFTGFIFVPQSPRYVSPRQAAAFPSGAAARVGVFAGQAVDEVLEIMREARLDFAQLHGNEDPRFCRAVGPERVIKVLWPERLAVNQSDGSERERIRALQRACENFASVCAFFLLDAGSSGGGSGRELPRGCLSHFVPPRPWLLAGGIGPANAAAVMAECAPFGIDCNSGVEAEPGVKDPAKLRALINTLTSHTQEKK